MSKRTIKDYLLISAKGLGMGAADVVPGVSGGTVAFITGIYEELLTSISNINFKAIKILNDEGVKAFWKHVNGWFFVSLLMGIVVSFVSLAKVAKYLMEHEPIALWSFFFGLVAASIFYVGKEVKNKDAKAGIGFIAGAAIAYYITILPPLTGDSDSLLMLFFAGMIAICAMILPGISGSFILLILGAYQTLMIAIDSMDLVVFAVFAAGAGAGLISFSRALKWLFEKYESMTIAVLSGFLLGSLNKLWPWKHVSEVYVKHAGEPKEEIVHLVENNVLPSDYQTFELVGDDLVYSSADPQVAIAAVCAVVGFALIFGIEFAAKKLGGKPEEK
ncbi:DUF368 domain-containing protein [Parvicella tangerina]|uniref:DUF368 domain-containing protein n=1 Tax=Parvicella tangerina TaxID=2829795 RepID=A0A916NB17_9FLAO|nr:DUF368 domain-containing protein [Parvicella tangerina]CAG5081971.1 hypothetical protein CRYO30217_01775 [Parvicella tangerina]